VWCHLDGDEAASAARSGQTSSRLPQTPPRWRQYSTEDGNWIAIRMAATLLCSVLEYEQRSQIISCVVSDID